VATSQGTHWNSPVNFSPAIPFSQLFFAQRLDERVDAFLCIRHFTVHVAHLEKHGRLATLQLGREALVERRKVRQLGASLHASGGKVTFTCSQANLSSSRPTYLAHVNERFRDDCGQAFADPVLLINHRADEISLIAKSLKEQQ
jgi:hypothetical protein